MTDNTPGQVPEALDDLYLKLHGLSKHLESSGRIDESDAPEAYPAILDAMNLVRRLQSEAAQVPATTAQPVQDYAELLESDEHIGTEERNEIAAELRRLHAQVAALTAQPAAPQGVAYAELPDKGLTPELTAALQRGADGVFDLLKDWHLINKDAKAGRRLWQIGRNLEGIFGCALRGDYTRASHGQAPAQAAPAAVAGSSEFPHEKMDAVALGRYKVVSSDQSMFYRFAVVAGDGAQQLYIGREVDCQNMARKFAGAFLDGAFAYHSMTAAPTAQPAPRQEAQEPFAWHVCSVNSDGSLSLEHAAAWEEAAHEHINDAITEHDIEGAGSWVVRPAYHAPQPSPEAQGDALPREDFAWLVVQEACETEPADEDDPECVRILRRDLKSSVLAAFLRLDAARAAQEGSDASRNQQHRGPGSQPGQPAARSKQ